MPARVRAVELADQLDECRLPGSVLADEGDDLSGRHRERDVVEHDPVAAADNGTRGAPPRARRSLGADAVSPGALRRQSILCARQVEERLEVVDEHARLDQAPGARGNGVHPGAELLHCERGRQRCRRRYPAAVEEHDQSARGRRSCREGLPCSRAVRPSGGRGGTSGADEACRRSTPCTAGAGIRRPRRCGSPSRARAR